MRTPAQQAASRANGACSSMDALSLHLLAKATVLNNESHNGLPELVRQHTPCIAPRDAVEETCSAIQSSPNDLECLAHTCGVLAGKNPRIRALRQPGERKHVNSNPARHASAQPPAGPDGGAHRAPEPLFMRLRTHIPVPRTSPREPQKPAPPPPQKNPRKPKKNPPKPKKNTPHPPTRRFQPVVRSC